VLEPSGSLSVAEEEMLGITRSEMRELLVSFTEHFSTCLDFLQALSVPFILPVHQSRAKLLQLTILSDDTLPSVPVLAEQAV
jgi:hypothetical protein